MTKRRSAQLTRHIHLWCLGLGSATIAGRRYSRFWKCARCKATRATRP